MGLWIQQTGIDWNDLTESQTNEIMELFENNPYSELDMMDFTNDDKWMKYDRRQALDNLTQNGERTVAVSGNRHNFSGSIFCYKQETLLGMNSGNDYFQKNNSLPELTGYLKKWLKTLPQLNNAGFSSENRDNDYLYNEIELMPLPDCFGSVLGWYHILSPQGYKEFYSPEDLRNAPAYEVEELGDGSFCLMTYPHPLEFSTAENTKRLIELTTYLYEKWQNNEENRN